MVNVCANRNFGKIVWDHMMEWEKNRWATKKDRANTMPISYSSNKRTLISRKQNWQKVSPNKENKTKDKYYWEHLLMRLCINKRILKSVKRNYIFIQQCCMYCNKIKAIKIIYINIYVIIKYNKYLIASILLNKWHRLFITCYNYWKIALEFLFPRISFSNFTFPEDIHLPPNFSLCLFQEGRVKVN